MICSKCFGHYAEKSDLFLLLLHKSDWRSKIVLPFSLFADIIMIDGSKTVRRGYEADDGISNRTSVEPYMRVRQFPQADVGVTRKKMSLNGTG